MLGVPAELDHRIEVRRALYAPEGPAEPLRRAELSDHGHGPYHQDDAHEPRVREDQLADLVQPAETPTLPGAELAARAEAGRPEVAVRGLDLRHRGQDHEDVEDVEDAELEHVVGEQEHHDGPQAEPVDRHALAAARAPREHGHPVAEEALQRGAVDVLVEVDVLDLHELLGRFFGSVLGLRAARRGGLRPLLLRRRGLGRGGLQDAGEQEQGEDHGAEGGAGGEGAALLVAEGGESSGLREGPQRQ
mmetsp:Transcript_123818/g.361518  ORF Transcript_123818/g.361518 Transcript_123818/m.361518 type:complete len:247 (+) Transcript_123818:524-1264(+)